MTTKIPVRTVYDNSNNPVGLSEFQDGEVIGIEHGGLGANTYVSAKQNLALDNSGVQNRAGMFFFTEAFIGFISQQFRSCYCGLQCGRKFRITEQ